MNLSPDSCTYPIPHSRTNYNNSVTNCLLIDVIPKENEYNFIKEDWNYFRLMAYVCRIQTRNACCCTEKTQETKACSLRFAFGSITLTGRLNRKRNKRQQHQMRPVVSPSFCLKMISGTTRRKMKGDGKETHREKKKQEREKKKMIKDKWKCKKKKDQPFK